MRPRNPICPHAQLIHRLLVDIVRHVKPQYTRQRGPGAPFAAAERRDLRGELARLKRCRLRGRGVLREV